MTLPGFVLTRGVTIGGAAALTAPLRIRLEVRASRSLIWDATGYRFEAQPAGIVTGAPSAAATLTLPRTDVAGWRDAATGSLIDVSAPDSFTHTYLATVTFLSAEGRLLGVPSVTIGPFVLPAGDGSVVDLDKVLTAPTVAGGVVAVPDSWSVLVAAAQAAALAATDAGNVTTGVFDVARIPALPYATTAWGDSVDAFMGAVPATYGTLLTPVETIAYNGDGTVASQTIGGVATTYTYNTDGTVATETRAGVTRTYGYTGTNLTAVS